MGTEMDKAEVMRFLKGQIKKHGSDFTLALKYRTENNKVRKRHGVFVELIAEEELVLFNPDKGTKGTYLLERITEIRKGTE